MPGEAKARTHKLGRPSSPWSYPLRPPRWFLSQSWADRGENPGLVPEYPALCLLQPAECAARPAGAQPPSPPSAVLTATAAAAGTSGSRRRGKPPRLRPRPSALRESGRRRSHRDREEGGGAHGPGEVCWPGTKRATAQASSFEAGGR